MTSDDRCCGEALWEPGIGSAHLKRCVQSASFIYMVHLQIPRLSRPLTDGRSCYFALGIARASKDAAAEIGQ